MNQIRAWVRQGRTDAWISHQLDISIDQLTRFKREHDLNETEHTAGPAVDPLSIPVPEPGSFEISEEEDEDEQPEESEESEGDSERSSSRSSSRGGRGGGGSRRGGRGGRGRSGGGDRTEESQDERRKEERPSRGREQRGRAERESRSGRSSGGRDKRDDRSKREDSDEESGKRRRGRRGGRRRSKIPNYEATFEHGGEGYGFWIDPSIVDNPVYGEHWAGHRAIVVRVDPETITIRRADANKKPDEGSD
jgi:hypothetical protein